MTGAPVTTPPTAATTPSAGAPTSTRRRTAPRILALCLVAPLVGLSALAPSVAATPTSRVAATPDAQVCPGPLDPVSVPTESGVSFRAAAASADGTLWSVGSQVVDGVFHPYAVTGPLSGPLQPVTVPEGAQVTSFRNVTVVDAHHAWLVAGTRLTGRPVRLLHWSGAAMRDVTPVTLLPQRYAFEFISASADDDVWVTVIDLGFRPGRPVVIHWDGGTWQQVDFPSPVSFADVAATTSGAWALVGVGHRSSLLRWDGTSWHEAPPPADLRGVSGMMSRGDHLALSHTSGRLSTWDGAAWDEAPAPPDFLPNSYDMAPDGTVWATGAIASDPSYLRLWGLSSWDGRRWTPTRGLVDHGDVYAVSASDAVVLVWANTSRPVPAYQLGRTCTTEVLPTGLRHPGSAAYPGSTFLVRDETGLAGGRTLVDRLGLFDPIRVGADHPASYAYPGAGTFEAQVRGVPGVTGAAATVTTSVVPYVGSDPWFPVSLFVGAVTAPTGWAYEVQAQAPGTAAFRTVRTGTDFLISLPRSAPHPGVWLYRSRMVRTDGTAQSGWSPAVAITR